MAVRIGVNPIGWSNDDMPELGGDIPLEVCLAEARQAGYAGIELGNKFPRQGDLLKAVMNKHGLKLISGWYGAQLSERTAEQEIAAMADHLNLLQTMGCPVMVFAETSNAVHGNRARPVSERPVLPQGAWAAFGARLTAVGDYLAERGMKLAYHHHMGTVIETADEIDRLMDLTGDSVGLLIDTGHATYAGADPLFVVQRHARRVVHVHCKDVRAAQLEAARARNDSFLDAVVAGVFTVPGDGMVDFPAVLSVLGRAGYDGWLVVEAEQDPAKANPLAYATMGFTNLRDAAGRAGLL
ncbi:MAG: myo-inosose-2 dehydratase [Kiloniellaceae bacterium]